MALPPEIRCHIYTFLPELVYKHVFPAINNSLVGTCCWPVYRLPTSLLLVSGVVHEETRDVLVQTPLRFLNEHYVPTLIIGPYLTCNSPLSIWLPNLLHSAAASGTDLNGRKYD
jgi:hypothetical protein